VNQTLSDPRKAAFRLLQAACQTKFLAGALHYSISLEND